MTSFQARAPPWGSNYRNFSLLGGRNPPHTSTGSNRSAILKITGGHSNVKVQNQKVRPHHLRLQGMPTAKPWRYSVPAKTAWTEADIAMLHGMDDNAHNAAKKDSYYGLLHFGQSEDADETPEIMEKDLADESADPEVLFFTALESAEESDKFGSVWTNLTDGQRDLCLKKLLKRTNVDIAREEGVSSRYL